MLRSACLALLVLSLPLAAGPAAAHRIVRGRLETTAAPCESLCTHGDMTGSIRGTFDFALETNVPTRVPDVSYYTGHTVIRTASGEIRGRNAGLWNLVTGQVVDRLTIESGTGDWEGASGVLVVFGIFDAAAGTGSNQYVGTVDVD